MINSHKPTYTYVEPVSVTSTPTPTPSKVDVLKEIVNEFDDQDIQTVLTILRVANCESGFNWDALNVNDDGSTDHGPMQLNSVHKHRGDIENWEKNVKIAKEIYLEQGFTPWVCY